MFKYYVLLAVFFFNIHCCEAIPIQTYSEVVNYTKESNWKENIHGVNLQLSFQQGNQIQNNLFFIAMSPEELLNFTLPIGFEVKILEEIPDKIVGTALFTLEIGSHTYRATGNAIHLTRVEYGLSEDKFMVIKAEKNVNWQEQQFLYHITLDSGDFFSLATSALDLFNDTIKAGMIVRLDREDFIPDNPGFSEFLFLTADGLELRNILKSKNSFWHPSSEQLDTMITVNQVNTISKGGFAGPYIITTIHFDNGGSFQMRNSWEKWTAAGHRWIYIRDNVFVDLDSARIVNINNYPTDTAYPGDYLTKTW